MQDINKQLIERIVRQVIEEQFRSKCDGIKCVDPSGVMSIKASQIKPEPFDTGKKGDKVWLTDLYSLNESPRLGAGIMEMDTTTFDWTLNYDEVDYVIEGTLEIIVDGRRTIGNAGDVILIPKGSKIQFSTPGFCRFMYVVYPANWADQQ